MTHDQEPTPEFVDRLEWQIRSEVRRRERFASPRRPLWRRRGLRTAAVVVLSVLVGWTGATAAQEVSQRRQRQLLELQSQSELEMAQLQLRFAVERLGEMQRLADAGSIGEEQLVRARFERGFLQRHVTALELDLDELRATGSPPRHDLVAPLVSGRDLVRERLELRLEDMRSQRSQAAAEVARFQGGVDAGTVEPFEVLYRRIRLNEVDREIALVRRSLALRDQFLSGELDEAAVRARRELLEARLDAERAADEVEIAGARMQHIDEIPISAEDGDLQRLSVRYQLEIAQARQRMADLRLRALREGGPDVE